MIDKIKKATGIETLSEIIEKINKYPETNSQLTDM